MKQDYSQHILYLLQQAGLKFTSGEYLSQQLNISRTAVWKHIKKLQSQGYEIQAVSKQGYQLLFQPVPIDYKRLTQLTIQNNTLEPIYIDQVESTQIEAKRLAELGAPQGTVVFAEQQNNGKGRLGRNWHSPYGKGIWMSVILRPTISIQFASQLTLLFAVALCETIREHLQLPAKIKWPNDILLNGKKCSGILLESVAEEQRLKYVIAGIGINVNLAKHDFSDELLPIATSLRIEANNEVDRTAFLVVFFNTLTHLLSVYEQDGFELIATKWESYADGFGQLKAIKQSDKHFNATPFKLDESGALWVRHDDGKEERLFAAEIGEVRE